MELISIDNLIKKLKEENINFGKGNPYNRLRYYTKIGWIPHMTRKKNEEGQISGHYPISVIEDLIKIENLKNEGKSNEEISKIIKTNKNETKQGVSFLKFFHNQSKSINLIFLIVIIFGFSYEILKGNSKIEIKNESIKLQNSQILPEKKIVDSGVSFLPINQSTAFIPSNKVSNTSIIFINMFNDIGLNNNYFIKELKVTQGFTIQTRYPVLEEIKLNWIILE